MSNNADNTVIRANNLSKCYQIYQKPIDRLKQAFFKNKRRFYQEFWALKNISFEVKKGETLGIIGSNGSGKSTLLQIICKILSQTSGDLKINGKISALLELGAGFNPEFTGKENIYMNASIMGLDIQEINSCFEKIVNFADIGDFINQPVKIYSSGMYVRLAFAVAIHVKPDILVIDEALSVGDIRFQQKCLNKIKKFCKNGTVLFVSHDTSAIIELCSRAIWIESGQIMLDSKPKLVVEKYIQYMYEQYEKKDFQDVHQDLPDKSKKNKQNNLDLSGFINISNSKLRQFGNKEVEITAIRLLSGENSADGIVYSGKSLEISLILHAHKKILSPIIGYFIKDRLGREILGDNTILNMQNIPSFKSGEKYLVSFRINNWPNFSEGDYSLTVAVANGNLNEHAQCHWIYDAIIFKSVPIRKTAGILSPQDTKVYCKKI